MGDDQRVRVALDQWAEGDATYKAATRAVQRAQASLRSVLSDEAWNVYLALEERVNARHNTVLSAVIRLASSVARPRVKKKATRRRKPA
jgi:hypothetical protein